MSALHVVHTLGTLAGAHGGPSRSVTALASALAADGVEVDLVAMAEPSDGDVRPSDDRVRVTRVPGHERDGMRQGRESAFGHTLAALVRPGTVVHDHGLWLPTNRAAGLVAAVAGAPLVVSPKGMLAAEAMAAGALKKRLAWALYQRRALARASAVSVTSEAEAADVRRAGVRAPVAVIPHGVTVPDDLPPRTAGADGARTALFLSRLHPHKGVDDLLEAWAMVHPAGWRLVVAGGGEAAYAAVLRQRAAELGVAGDVSFAGAVDGDAKWALYRGADLFVLPSRSENFGAAIAEALAAGVPVVTTRGTPWAGLRDHDAGWWVEAGAASLAAALADATARPAADLAAMGARGAAWVARTFSWTSSAEAHAALYRWLLGQGERPACVVSS